MEISRNSVGMAVRAARKAAGLSLSDLFGKTQISVSALSRVETGARALEFVEAAHLADALNVSLEHFRTLAATFENEGLAEQFSQKREALSDLRKLQQLALLTAVEAASAHN